VLWPDRPPNIYKYYALNIGTMEGQGYTIHHASGWYLNFGIAGLVFGALLLGVLWAAAHNYSLSRHPSAAHFWNVLAAVAPSGFASAIFVLLRAGPEAYKGLLVDGLLIPAVCVAAASSWVRVHGEIRDGERPESPPGGNATVEVLPQIPADR
jgi:hypothetical protein